MSITNGRQVWCICWSQYHGELMQGILLIAVLMNTATNNDQHYKYHSLSCTLILKTLLSPTHECGIKCRYYLMPPESQDCLLMLLPWIMPQPYSKVPCLIPKITPCWSDSIHSPCCYTFASPLWQCTVTAPLCQLSAKLPRICPFYSAYSCLLGLSNW